MNAVVVVASAVLLALVLPPASAAAQGKAVFVPVDACAPLTKAGVEAAKRALSKALARLP